MTQSIVGIPVEFAPDKTLYVHPITRTLIKKYKDQFRRMEQGEITSHLEIFDVQADMVFDCLKLNYPEMTGDEFDALLNGQNHPLAWMAVNSDFQGVETAKKAMALLRSGSTIGTETPPALPT